MDLVTFRSLLSTVSSLRCEHEKADNRLMLQIDDAVRSGYNKVIITSLTPIFLSQLYTVIQIGYILIF